jgi:hypothetical protein
MCPPAPPPIPMGVGGCVIIIGGCWGLDGPVLGVLGLHAWLCWFPALGSCHAWT